MEFPKLGQHCSDSTCKQLDFLPMKCDACDRIFCKDHIQYDTHGCSESYKKDKQVPVCPLCNTPIPLLAGELADVKVGRHIDSFCQSDPAKERRKIYTNKCSYKTCKQKELMPVQCEKCRLNFCLKHRHETDHDCQGFQGTGRAISKQGAAAISRNKASSKVAANHKVSSRLPAPNQSSSVARNAAPNLHGFSPSYMTEDEAVSKAIELSLADNRGSTNRAGQDGRSMTQQEREDAMLAAALAASQQETHTTRPTNRPQRQTSCEIM